MRADLASFENALLEYGWLDAYRSQYAQDRYSANPQALLRRAGRLPAARHPPRFP